jgi:hypothetical protein
MAEWLDIVRFATHLGGVTEGSSYGEPSLKIGKSLLTRHRLADDSIVIKGVDFDERDELIERFPNIFFVEDHYLQYDIILARLAHATADQLTPYIERTWLGLAKKSARQ